MLGLVGEFTEEGRRRQASQAEVVGRGGDEASGGGAAGSGGGGRLSQVGARAIMVATMVPRGEGEVGRRWLP